MLKMKKILGISLAVLFLLTVTAAAASASVVDEPIFPSCEIRPMSGDAPLKVTFYDTSTGGTALWKWWSWGDGTVGSSSTANKMTHTYKYPGTFDFYLKATNNAGPTWVHYTITVY